MRFPVVEGVPVLVNESNSVFLIDEIVSEHLAPPDAQRTKLRSALARSIPSIGKKIKSQRNYQELGQLLLSQNPSPRVLIVGGGSHGQGMDALTSNPAMELVETDVSFGPRTVLICDAHDIPFDDESFDGLVAQAVLEHVVDPYRCAEEIHRVLKPHGVVYAETPFMVQVHLQPYDFTRFTHLGQRRLFRRFDEIESGAVGGTGMALAWSYQHFLRSLTESRHLRSLLTAFAGFTSFFLKYVDYFSIDKSGTLDAAAAYYFLGRKENHILSDRELLGLYRRDKR